MTGRQRGTMVAVILGSAIVFLDTSVVNLALPRIGQELPSSLFAALEAQSYVANGYFLSLSALLILAGALTDVQGRRRMFALGLTGFGLSSALCGLAPTMELLILFRILQGATGALVVPGSLSIITATFDEEARGRAFGVWASASAATTILGPLVGGMVVHAISWRAAFLLNIPFLMAALFATLRWVPESRDDAAPPRFDWAGSAVVALAVGGLAFGVIRGQQTAWKGMEVLVSLLIGGLAAVALVPMMRYRADPLVPPSLFRSRTFTVANLATFVVYGALYVSFIFQGLYLIGTLGYNEPAAGLAGLPGTLLLVLFSTRFGRLAARVGPRRFLTLGPAIMGVGLLWLTRFPARSRAWLLGIREGESLIPPTDYFVDLFPAMVLFGVGLMMLVAPLTTAVMTSVPEQKAGLASAINNAISRVGAPVVTALVFIGVTSVFYSALENRIPGVETGSPEFRAMVAPLNPPRQGTDPEVADAAREASTAGFRLAMLVSAGLLGLGAAISGLGLRPTSGPTPPRRVMPPPSREAGPARPVEAETVPATMCCQGPAAALGSSSPRDRNLE